MEHFIPDFKTPYFIQSAMDGLMIDGRTDDKAGSTVHLWEPNLQSQQQWLFEDAGGGKVRLKCQRNGLYLHYSADGTAIKEVLKPGNGDQEFYLTPSLAGGVRIQCSNRYKLFSNRRDMSKPRQNGTKLQGWDPEDEISVSFTLAKKVPTQLRLLEVRCIKPAGGVFALNTWLGNAATVGGAMIGVAGAAGAATSAGAVVVAGVSTGGVGFAVVGAAVGVVGLATLGTSVMDGFTGSDDDLFIEMNGKQIWPANKRYGEIGAGEVLTLNKILSRNWTKNDSIKLWDYDSVSDNDALTGSIKIDPEKAVWRAPFTVIDGDDDEGSLYALTFRLI